VSAFDLKQQSYSQIKARWEKALQDEMDKGQWPAVPEPMLSLPEPGKSHLSREHADRMVKELHAESVIKSANSNVDHKLWARRIIKRQEAGDKTLTMIQIRFAQEALQT
jgi:hypothetical protein